MQNQQPITTTRESANKCGQEEADRDANALDYQFSGRPHTNQPAKVLPANDGAHQAGCSAWQRRPVH